MISEKKFDDIFEGDKAQFEITITGELIDAFVALSGDSNPLHTDEHYATETPFGGRIAHGMIAGALFSRLVGLYLPGKYSLYLSQTLLFKKPLRIGTNAIIEGIVTQKTDAVRTLTLSTMMHNKTSGEVLVEGEAKVRLLK